MLKILVCKDAIKLQKNERSPKNDMQSFVTINLCQSSIIYCKEIAAQRNQNDKDWVGVGCILYMYVRTYYSFIPYHYQIIIHPLSKQESELEQN